MSESKIIELEKFGISTDADQLDQWRETDNPEEITDEFVVSVLQAYFSKIRALVIDESIRVVEKRVDRSSNHNHVNQKEIISGRAKANMKNQDVEFEFGFYCGRKQDGFVYDAIEVDVTSFN